MFRSCQRWRGSISDHDTRLLSFSGRVRTASCSVNIYVTLKRKASVGCQQGPHEGPNYRVSPHQGGLSRQSAQPATENGAAVCTSQRDDIPAPAHHAEGTDIANLERNRGDWPGEIVEEVGSMVRYCEQLRLGSNAHVFVATAFVRKRSLTHFINGNDRQVVRSFAFACGVTAAAAVGELCKIMPS